MMHTPAQSHGLQPHGRDHRTTIRLERAALFVLLFPVFLGFALLALLCPLSWRTGLPASPFRMARQNTQTALAYAFMG